MSDTVMLQSSNIRITLHFLQMYMLFMFFSASKGLHFDDVSKKCGIMVTAVFIQLFKQQTTKQPNNCVLATHQ